LETVRYDVTTEYVGMRRDRFLTEMDSEHTRSFLQKEITDGGVLVNGKPAKAGIYLMNGRKVVVK
jgi:ribosomal 50S subunit-recycling heat shock protein